MNPAESNWDLVKQKNIVFSYILGLKDELKYYHCIIWPQDGSKYEMKSKIQKKIFTPGPHLNRVHQIQSPTLYQLSYMGNSEFAQKSQIFLLQIIETSLKKKYFTHFYLYLIEMDEYSASKLCCRFKSYQFFN